MASIPFGSRIGFLDSLRGYLSLLVILHHVAITYGAEGGWYYKEHTSQPVVNLLLTTFCAFNQFYFMGLFFLLAGLFTPASLNRKGNKIFFQERLTRLGIPLLCFGLIVSPPLEYFSEVYQDGYNKGFFTYLIDHLPLINAFSPGPLWFVETLLGFSLLYLLWAKWQPPISPKINLQITPFQILLFSFLLALLSFLVRFVYPIGALVWHLQFAFFPQYILLFSLGIWLASPKALGQLPKHWLKPCMTIATVSILMVPALVILNGRIDQRFLGGWHWQAIALCLIEAAVCSTACIAVILIFRDWVPSKQKFWNLVGENSYGIFIVHAPICFFVAIALRSIDWYPLVKFAVVSTLSVGLSLFLSHTLRRLGGSVVRNVVG
ncbi:MAG: acyltransferase family protein [Anaerolineae bacterium]|nr:acyltransferase family protein [Gloeobacterales cyanobacterium ES-bin-313]